jgi:hypothetical protein
MKKSCIYVMVAMLLISVIAGTVGCGDAKESKVIVIGTCNYNPGDSCWTAYWNAQPNLNESTEGDWAHLTCEETLFYQNPSDHGYYDLGNITAQDKIDNPELEEAINFLFSTGMECECELRLDESEWEYLQANPQYSCEFELVAEEN